MTTALAYGLGEHVWIAADSMTNVYDRPVMGAAKIVGVEIGGVPTFFVVAGAGGLMQLLRYKTCFDQPTDDLDAWAQDVAMIVTKTAVDHGMVQDGEMDATVLLACKGHVWTIAHHYAVAHPDRIGAIGNGEQAAIGAMDALLETSPTLDPAIAVYKAVDIAVRRDRFSGGEVRVFTTAPSDETSDARCPDCKKFGGHYTDCSSKE